jgi:hypothetical protein
MQTWHTQASMHRCMLVRRICMRRILCRLINDRSRFQNFKSGLENVDSIRIL